MKALLVICLVILLLAFFPVVAGYVLGGIMFCLAWWISHWFITIPITIILWFALK